MAREGSCISTVALATTPLRQVRCNTIFNVHQDRRNRSPPPPPWWWWEKLELAFLAGKGTKTRPLQTGLAKAPRLPSARNCGSLCVRASRKSSGASGLSAKHLLSCRSQRLWHHRPPPALIPQAGPAAVITDRDVTLYLPQQLQGCHLRPITATSVSSSRNSAFLESQAQTVSFGEKPLCKENMVFSEINSNPKNTTHNTL